MMDYNDEKYWDELYHRYPYIDSFGIAYWALANTSNIKYGDVIYIDWLEYYARELRRFSLDVDKDINYHKISLNSEEKHEIMVAKENSKPLLEKVDKLLSLLQL